jgi:aspartyl/asparaginyl beta-hydroxylase (cupin superfamily)/Tfp pilus assembly protein PilF
MARDVNAPPPEARARVQAALSALREGRHAEARALFESAVAGGQTDATVQLGLAYACVGLRDVAAAAAAVERTLALEPRNLRALILKADLLLRAGDARNALAFYQAAVRGAQAVPATQPLPPDLAREVARAEAACRHEAVQLESTLRERLASHSPGVSSARFEQSLDVLFGRRRIYFQEPRQYYFPELPQVQFYPRERFPWLDRVEAATGGIREELQQLLAEEGAFAPYVRSVPGRPRPPESTMLDNPDWSAFYLWKDGTLVPENAARCPCTIAALEGAPLNRLPARSPSILFSLLRPRTRIPPHNGLVNTRLICHLPLIVPPGCGLRVGNETRPWVEGQAWVFDDSIEHEAWNDSDQTRVILLFEIWRPELDQRERELVQALFASLDAQSGQKPAWEI